MDSKQPESLLQLAISLSRKGFNTEEIATQLRINGAADNLVQQAIDEIKQLRLGQEKKHRIYLVRHWYLFTGIRLYDHLYTI